MTKQSFSDDVLWANEIMEVYKAQGSLPDSRNWSSTSSRQLFEQIKDEKIYLAFIKDMVPKAAAIISKAGLADASDAVLEIDAKTIGDLKHLLADAISASQERRVVTAPMIDRGEVGVSLEELLGSPVLTAEDVF